MRDIKFRVYNPRDNKVHYDITGFEYIDNGNMSGVFIDGAFFLKEEVELMQYTGLKDKNGKEIFEGDIVKIDNDVASMFNIKSTGKVEYNNGLFLVQNGDEISILSSLFILSDTKYCLRGEVIGNIYDNPELLEKGEQS